MALPGEAAPDEPWHEQTDDGYRMIEAGKRILQPQPGLIDAIGRAAEVHRLQMQTRPKDCRKRLLPLQRDSGDRRLAGEDERRQSTVDGRAGDPSTLGV